MKANSTFIVAGQYLSFWASVEYILQPHGTYFKVLVTKLIELHIRNIPSALEV